MSNVHLPAPHAHSTGPPCATGPHAQSAASPHGQVSNPLSKYRGVTQYACCELRACIGVFCAVRAVSGIAHAKQWSVCLTTCVLLRMTPLALACRAYVHDGGCFLFDMPAAGSVLFDVDMDTLHLLRLQAAACTLRLHLLVCLLSSAASAHGNSPSHILNTQT